MPEDECCVAPRLRCRSRRAAVGWLAGWLAAEERASAHTSDLVVSPSVHLFVLLRRSAPSSPPTRGRLFPERLCR